MATKVIKVVHFEDIGTGLQVTPQHKLAIKTDNRTIQVNSRGELEALVRTDIHTTGLTIEGTTLVLEQQGADTRRVDLADFKQTPNSLLSNAAGNKLIVDSTGKLFVSPDIAGADTVEFQDLGGNTLAKFKTTLVS